MYKVYKTIKLSIFTIEMTRDEILQLINKAQITYTGLADSTVVQALNKPQFAERFATLTGINDVFTEPSVEPPLKEPGKTPQPTPHENQGDTHQEVNEANDEHSEIELDTNSETISETQSEDTDSVTKEHSKPNSKSKKS